MFTVHKQPLVIEKLKKLEFTYDFLLSNIIRCTFAGETRIKWKKEKIFTN